MRPLFTDKDIEAQQREGHHVQGAGVLRCPDGKLLALLPRLPCGVKGRTSSFLDFLHMQPSLGGLGFLMEKGDDVKRLSSRVVVRVW